MPFKKLKLGLKAFALPRSAKRNIAFCINTTKNEESLSFFFSIGKY